MKARAILIAALALALLAPCAARADLSLFGSYWDNVARQTAQNDGYKVLQLIGAGHDPNEVDDNGRTGLLIAAGNGNVAIAQLLVKSGAHLDAKDRLGNTPLHIATDRNHVEVVRLLLKSGASIDPQNRDGMTPLMIAASRGYGPIVQALLAKGANPRKTDFTGRDALGWAEESHRAAIMQMLTRAAEGR